jgi:hypothetical protein
VLPKSSITAADIGRWLKNHVATRRNTVRFLLPRKDMDSIFNDKSLLVLARAVYLANQWKKEGSGYAQIHIKFQKELRNQIKNRFDRFAILETWNFGSPQNCTFAIELHKANGEQILNAVDARIRTELFTQEDFEALVLDAAVNSRSVADVLDQLREPRPNGEISLPWLGEVAIRERIIRLCARGLVAINLGRAWLQSNTVESEDDAWQRMKGQLPQGKALASVTIHPPGAAVVSGGGQTATVTTTTGGNGTQTGTGAAITATPAAIATTPVNGGNSGNGIGTALPDIFGGSAVKPRTTYNAPPAAPINLLGKLESWGINVDTPVHNLCLSIAHLSGAQIRDILKKLPDGVACGIDLEKE